MAPQKTPAPNKNAKKKAAAKSGTKTPIKKSKVASPKTTLESKKKMIKNLDAKKGGVSAFDMEAFVKVKFSALEKTAHQKKVMLKFACFNFSLLQKLAGRTNSTVADLSKFNLRMANEVYKVEKEESLEAILLALHLPADQVAMDVTDLHP